MMVNNSNGLDEEKDELDGDEEDELAGFHEVDDDELDGEFDEDDKPGHGGPGKMKDDSDDYDDSAKNDW